MVKLRSVTRAEDDDLRSRVHFCPETGQIWLHEHRMLLVHAEAQASLRKELIDTLGMDRAQGLLTRMGYASGVRDAELARIRAQDSSDIEAFMTGPQLHTLEGIVRVTRIKLELDRVAGKFYGEFLWENSWEGQWHRHYYGIHSEPVCWTQIGYACGYTSAFMGRPVLYKEVECVGMGHNNCRIIGKPIEEWENADEYKHFSNRESIADQLFDLQTQVVQLRSSIGEKEKLPADMVGDSPSFRAAYELLKQAAKTRINVLLLGETGVGKEMFARSLHELGPRRDAPFIAINCAAIPHDLVESELFGVEKGAYTGALVSRPGRFERADGGTLFLDEVGDLPLPAQSKLLRVLQEGELERVGGTRTIKVDVRVVAATHRDLEAEVEKGRFREDLYYRLNVMPLYLPPLRDRMEDIPEIARFLVEKISTQQGRQLNLTDAALRILMHHDWPGNVRELENCLERASVMTEGNTIDRDAILLTGIDEKISASRGAIQDLDLDDPNLDEREKVIAALEQAGWVQAKAARLLDMTPRQIAYRIQTLNIKVRQI